MRHPAKLTVLIPISLYWMLVSGVGHASRGTQAQTAVESWTLESWAGDDRPYQTTRSATDKAIAAGQRPEKIANQNKAQAERSPGDPLAQFRWAYSERLAALAARPRDANRLAAVAAALQKAPPPHAYNYTRLRFLLASEITPARGLAAVGKRLLARDPDDAVVKYNLVQILGNSLSRDDRGQAIRYAQEMVRAAPGDADNHGNLAGAYLSMLILTHDRANAGKAVSEYREYLRLAPADAPYRVTAERMVRVLSPVKG